MAEPIGRSQPAVSLRKTFVRSEIVASSTRTIARQSPLPELGRAGGKHWSERMNALGFLSPHRLSSTL